MSTHLLILNYNGRHLLAECLPSVLRAAELSRHECSVTVIDNQSTDDSVAWLLEHFPSVSVIRLANRGLCSFNAVVPRLADRVAILLNNDIKLAADCVDPLVEPILASTSCFMAAPLCWQFDEKTYEGFKTTVRWRWGLVQATALYPGHEAAIRVAGLTASAGAAMAVDCRKFTQLGGFDPLYLPGRLEDLDFCFRGYQAGYRAEYVPAAVAYHRGMATFGDVFGPTGCDRLALRNTLLFQWKNLRCPGHIARQFGGVVTRLARDVLRAPWATRERRWEFVRALAEAWRRWGMPRTTAQCTGSSRSLEREFFRRFHPESFIKAVSDTMSDSVVGSHTRNMHEPLTAQPRLDKDTKAA